MCSLHWNSEQFPGQHIGRCGTPSDVGGSTGCQCSVDSLRPSQTKFQHRFTGGGVTDPRCLRGDQCLEVDDIQQSRLQNLALHDWASHANEWFVRKHHCSFGNGVNITGENRRTEFIQESVIEQWQIVIPL